MLPSKRDKELSINFISFRHTSVAKNKFFNKLGHLAVLLQCFCFPAKYHHHQPIFTSTAGQRPFSATSNYPGPAPTNSNLYLQIFQVHVGPETLRHSSAAQALPASYGKPAHNRGRATVGAEPCTAGLSGTGFHQTGGAAFGLCALEA